MSTCQRLAGLASLANVFAALCAALTSPWLTSRRICRAYAHFVISSGHLSLDWLFKYCCAKCNLPSYA